MKHYKLCFLMVTILLNTLSYGLIYFHHSFPQNEMTTFFKNDLRSAKITEPFFIDGNQGWLDLKNEGNCTGEGTYSNPYVIEDWIINGGGTGRISEIQNSNVYFIIKNFTISNGTAGIYCHSVSNGKFINNTITNCITGIHFNILCKNNTIFNNTLENNEYGILFATSYGPNKISNNNISNNGHTGIALEFSHGNEVSDNYLSNNGDGNDSDESGVYLSISSNNIISNNTIFSTIYGTGLYLRGGSSNNQILLNKIHNNKNGIQTYNSDSFNTSNIFKGNILSNNSEYGFLIDHTNENNITQNVIQYNEFGLKVRASDNLIYNNTFIGNEAHGWDVRSAFNYWNNSEIGNFWGDYGGVDTNDDGVGDTPYGVSTQIGGYSYDYLPIWFDGPTLNITTPENYSIFTSNFKPPSFSLSILDPNLDDIWYTINLEEEKYFTESNGSLDYNVWINLMNGNITLSFYANDTFGNINSNHSIIIKETQPPELLIFEPNEGAIYGNTAPKYNLTITDLPLNSTWYTLDGGISNYTIFNIFSNNTSGDINQTAWDSFQDSLITLQFYGKDIIGRICFNTVSIYKDVASPLIFINSPTLNYSYGEDSPHFDLTIIEGNKISSWYSINGEVKCNFTGSTGEINQTIWNRLPEGSILITFYVKDIAGNIGYQEITVIKVNTTSTPPPEPPEPSVIPGYDLYLLLGALGVISALFIRKRVKS